MTAKRAAPEPAIGVLGGSGLYEMEGLEEIRWVKVRTPFGEPSDAYCTGRFAGRRVIFLPRHGRGHRLTPSELNYRANIYGMKMLGARALLSISAVGSMKEDIHPLDLVVPDQFYDHTRRRPSSFFGDGIVAHVGMAHPVCAGLTSVLAQAGSDGPLLLPAGLDRFLVPGRRGPCSTSAGRPPLIYPTPPPGS